MCKKYNTEQFAEIERHKNNIYVLRHDLQSMVPQHKHRQGHILYVIDGVANVDIGNSTYYIPNGYFVWIPQEVSHRICFDSPSIQLLNIYYPTNSTEPSFFSQMGVYSIPALLYHTFEQVNQCSSVYTQEDWQYNLLSTIKSILPNIINPAYFPLRLPTSEHPIIIKILSIIHNNYNSTITLNDVAAMAGVSSRTLNRYINKELHISFIQYVRVYRMIMAIKLMIHTKDNISNIAYSVGYESLTAFSNTFYNVTGHRPSAFQKTLL